MIKDKIRDGSVVESWAFPKLKNLQLIDPPRLSNICHNLSLDWPSLQKITINTSPELKDFPSNIENATKIRAILCTQA